MRIDRRRFVSILGGTSLLALWPQLQGCQGSSNSNSNSNSNSEARLLVLLLRGGLDGLHAMPALADPAYARLRGAWMLAEPLVLDASFALHPALGFMHGLYRRQQLLPLVATAPPYRMRSHFDAQDCLENGTSTPGGESSGWLSRCVAEMGQARGLALTTVMPLILRGSGHATSWSPPLPQQLDPTLLQKLQPLYAADPVLAAPFADALEGEENSGRPAGAGGLPQTMAAAARFMTRADGPRIGFAEDTGWDTHGNQAQILQRKLAELDRALKVYHDGMGAAWQHTVVAIVTEFGRTARINGSAGTDHGTGTAAFLAGGAVRGGRILGDWPGLAVAQLNESRDLRATTDLRALFKGVLAGHVGVGEGALEARVFPDSRRVRPLDGLFA